MLVLIYAVLFQHIWIGHTEKVSHWKLILTKSGFWRSRLVAELSGSVTSITTTTLKSTLVKFYFAPLSFQDWGHLSLLSFRLHLCVRRKHCLSQIVFLQRPRLLLCVCVLWFVRKWSPNGAYLKVLHWFLFLPATHDNNIMTYRNITLHMEQYCAEITIEMHNQ